MRLLFLAAAILAAPLLTATPAQAQSDWTVDEAHTNVGFKVRHMMVSWVRGSFGKAEGTVSYEPGKPDSLAVDISIPVKGVDTDNGKRDEHLRSPDFFDVLNFPAMTFKSKKATETKDGIDLVGDLTIKGVTKEVTLSVEAMSDVLTDPWGNTKIGTSASAKIDRQDFGLSWSKSLDGGGVVVGDEVRIELDIELNLKK